MSGGFAPARLHWPGARRRAAPATLAVLLLLSAGCATAPSDRPAPGQRVTPDAPYLPSPVEGYPRALDLTSRRQIEAAHDALLAGQRGPALEISARLLDRDPGLHPALVLGAQADFLDGRYDRAVAALRPVTAELPGYRAAQLLLARSLETTGDLPGALEAYRALGEGDALAAGRAAELRPRSIEILTRRVDDALARGRTGEAATALARLQDWAAGETATLEAALAVAAGGGDRRAELEALRPLAARLPDKRELAVRRAELELEVGDASFGLRAFQELAARHPDDLWLADRLAHAKFLWRLQLLPEEVRELGRQPELTRGEFAGLLYWIFPDVRYGRADGARIANDVLDDPHREAIVRVVNLGLMEVDERLHQFGPERPLKRSEALASLVALLEPRRPRLACLGDERLRGRVAIDTLCRVAAACGLVPEAAECLPSAIVSGDTALEMSRVALDRLGVQ